jgi:ribosomal protein S18 acetylase RimI-like enzyme
VGASHAHENRNAHLGRHPRVRRQTDPVLEIRRVRSDEWKELRELRLEALRDSPEAFWTRYDEALGRSDDEWRDWMAMPCHVAADCGRLVGMVAAVRPEGDPTKVDLVAMFVSRAARGRGIGAALVQAQLAWARVEGFARVNLMVNVENTSAYRLYERHGFRDTGRREPLRDGPETLAEMVCEL